MLSVQVDEAKGVAILEPQGALSKDDFARAAKAIVVRLERFPGWDSFGALASHLKFVRGHHRKVRRVALCTELAKAWAAGEG
jgi:hypothetical protein